MDPTVFSTAVQFSVAELASLVVEYVTSKLSAASPQEIVLASAVVFVAPFGALAIGKATRATVPRAPRRAVTHAGFGADLSTQLSVTAVNLYDVPEHQSCLHCGR